MIYLVVILLILFLSFRYDINGKTKYRDQWYLAILVFLILIAGLRWRIGTDTARYLHAYYVGCPTLASFKMEYFMMIGEDPGWMFLNAIVKSMGLPFFYVQLVHASIINILIFKFIKRHCEYIFTCVFFYFIFAYLGYNFEIMRGSLSIVLCLYANDFILEKKWIKGYILYFVALLFHGQTIVLLLIPLLFFMRLNFMGVVILLSACVLGYIFQSIFSDYIYLIEFNESIQDKAEGYLSNDDGLGGVSGFGSVLKTLFGTFLFGLFSLWYAKKQDKYKNLSCMEPMMMLFLLFTLLKLGLRIAYRYEDYFKIYAIVYYSVLFVDLVKMHRKSTVIVAYTRTFLIFSLLIVTMLLTYFNNKKMYVMYYPYSSVIERHVDKARESKFPRRPYARYDEY